MGQNDFIMKPKSDFAFKEIMENKNARLGLLSAVLAVAPESIRETRILNTELRRTHADDKLGILDVRIEMHNGTQIDVEIQLSELKVWANRSLFYLAKMYTEQIERGEDYSALRKCISISILDFPLFDGTGEFYSRFHIQEDTRHTLYTDKMEFHVIELTKLPEELKENSSDLLLWAKFINSEKREDFEMLAGKNPYIKSAYEQLQIVSQDKDKRMEYEARQKAIRDYNQCVLEAEQRGEQRGRAAGEHERSVQIALDMIKDSFSVNTISRLTKLPEKEVEALRDETQKFCT